MLRWTVIFFVIAVVAAILGFGGIAGEAVGIAKVLFVIALVLSVIGFARGYGQHRNQTH